MFKVDSDLLGRGGSENLPFLNIKNTQVFCVLVDFS